MKSGELFVQNFLEDFNLIFSWLPKNFPEREVEDILGNFWLNPTAVPTTEVALAAYQAMLRVELSKAAPKAAKIYQIPEKIVSASRNLSEALLVFLDGAQPQGLFDVEVGNFKLATCFCFEGKLAPEKLENKLAEAEVDFGIGQKPKIQIMSDQIVRVPLSFGFSAQVNLRVFGDFKIEAGKKFSGRLVGSQLGLIFDGRGRPIIPPGEAGDREKRSQTWRQALEHSQGFKLSDF